MTLTPKPQNTTSGHFSTIQNLVFFSPEHPESPDDKTKKKKIWGIYCGKWGKI